jgi:regulator of replication initiation timing
MEYAHDSDNDNDNENGDDEPTKEQLYDLMQQTRNIAIAKDKEYKKLSMKVAILEKVLSELKTNHESLVEDYEDLGKAHSKLEKAHSLLLEQQAKKEGVVSCDIGVTCDIIDESSYEPIIMSNANPSYSSSSTTTDSTSSTSDSFTCDASLMVENETLKREVDELTHALGKAYGGEARLLKCLGSQRFSLNKEGLGYTPKKSKSDFATPKPSFVKGNGRFCNRFKQVGHLEHNCNKKNQSKNLVNAIPFDSCYVLTKGVKGVKAKFIGTPIVVPKKKAI